MDSSDATPRMDAFGHTVLSSLSAFSVRGAHAAAAFDAHAAPLARAWRQTIDDYVAPAVRKGLVSVGSGAVGGLDMVASAVMGKEAKEETAEALDTIARAIIKGDGEEENGEEELIMPRQDSHFLSTRYREDQQSFGYQQMDPTQLHESYYPPHYQIYPSSPYLHNHINPHFAHNVPQVSTNPDDLLSLPTNNHNYHQHNVPGNRVAHVPVEEPFLPDPVFPAHYHSIKKKRKSQSVEEALYVLGKNLLGQNVTDRLFPVVKQMAVGLGQVGEGLGTITNALPISSSTVEFDQDGVRVKTVQELQQQNAGGLNDG